MIHPVKRLKRSKTNLQTGGWNSVIKTARKCFVAVCLHGIPGHVFYRQQVKMIHTNKQEEKNITFLLDAFTDNRQLRSRLDSYNIFPTCWHYIGGIWKRSLFVRLGLPSTLIGEIVHRKRSFSKRLLKTEKFENGALCFSVDWKHFKMELFENDDVTIIRWFVCRSLPQTQIQNGGHVGSTKTLLCACSRVHSSVSAACNCCVFKFLWRSAEGKHFIRFLVWTKNIWCVFRVKPPFSNSSGVMWTGP